MGADPESVKADAVVIRFAGDSGDGMQLSGTQFSSTSAIMGNDLATFPDFPAEIRAPAGTTYGVSGFQVHIASKEILTPGDRPDVLVAMNPAALRVNLEALKKGGVIVINESAFAKGGLKKAGYERNPLETGELAEYRVVAIDIVKHTLDAVAPFKLGSKDSARCKNVWALGLLYWMYGRDRQPTIEWLSKKFSQKPAIRDANIAALNAGHIYGENAGLPDDLRHVIEPADMPSGLYRAVDGNQALALGLAVGAERAGLNLFYGSYPITPASSLLHNLAKLKDQGVMTFQAEDEIAAVCAAIGASYGGCIGVTGTSGPGLALKAEAIGLAVSAELPLVVVDVQRGGPSTGMPTKTEQADLLQALHGRNGDAPVIVLAPKSSGDCFDIAIEAIRLSTKYMVPVLILSDGYIANCAEPWLIPNLEDIQRFDVRFAERSDDFHPFLRDDETLARNWPRPGQIGLEHRIGGIEKDYDTGNISYDPANHRKMTEVRAEKVARATQDFEPIDYVLGSKKDCHLIIGWGSTYGALFQAVSELREKNEPVAYVHLRHLCPFARGVDELMSEHDRIVVAEMNHGMLARHLRAEFGRPVESVTKVEGRPFYVSDLVEEISRKIDEVKA